MGHHSLLGFLLSGICIVIKNKCPSLAPPPRPQTADCLFLPRDMSSRNSRRPPHAFLPPAESQDQIVWAPPQPRPAECRHLLAAPHRSGHRIPRTECAADNGGVLRFQTESVLEWTKRWKTKQQQQKRWWPPQTMAGCRAADLHDLQK